MIYLNILICLSSAYALAWALTSSLLVEEIRTLIFSIEERYKNILTKKIRELFSCIYCMSFWTGVLIFTTVSSENVFFKLPISVIDVILLSLTTVTFAFIIERILYLPNLVNEESSGFSEEQQ